MNRRARVSPTSSFHYQALEQRHLLAALGNGEVVIDNVFAGQPQTFEIEVTTPGNVYVSVGETFEFESLVEVSVVSPSDQTVASETGGSGVSIDFEAAEIGTYEVVVSDPDFFSGQGFQFRIRTLAINQQFDLLPDIDGFFENGAEFSATLPENGLSVFQFSVDSEDSNSETLFLGGGIDSSVSDPRGNVTSETFRPDGSLLVTSGPLLDLVFEVDESDFGVYTVVVRNFSEVSNVRFRSLVLSQPFEEIPGLDAFLENGQEVSVQVDGPQANVFQFDLEANEQTLLSVIQEELGAESRQWVLYDPNGDDILGGRGFESFEDFVPEFTGRYTLLLTAIGSLPSASFNVDVRVLSVGSPQQHVEGRDQVLVNGERATSTLPPSGFNSYTIDVAEPSNVLLLPENIDQQNSVQLVVFSPSGNEVGFGFVGNDEIVEFFASEPGTYQILFLNDRFNLANEVAIRAVVFDNNPVPFVAEDAVLEDGEVIVTPITEQGFYLFQFELSESQRAEFQVGDISSSHQLTVFSPTGEQVIADQTLRQLSFAATESGVYTGVIDGRFISFDNPNAATLLQFAFFVDSPADPLEISFLRDGQPAESPELLVRPDQVSSLSFEFNQTLSNFVFGGISLTRFGDPLGVDVRLPSLIYDPLTRTGTFEDFALLNLELEPGYYTIEISANTLQFSGPTFENELFQQNFYVALPGDLNLDGRVDVLGDAFGLVANLGVAAGASWSNGDFNGDGQVTVLDDAFTLVENLGRSVVVPPDVGQPALFGFAQTVAGPELAASENETASPVTTANSRDLVFASLDDDPDELFERQRSRAGEGKSGVGLAEELTLS